MAGLYTMGPCGLCLVNNNNRDLSAVDRKAVDDSKQRFRSTLRSRGKSLKMGLCEKYCINWMVLTGSDLPQATA